MKAHPDINDTLQREGPDAVRARHDRARKYQPTDGEQRERKPPYKFIMFDDIKLEPKRYLIDRFLGMGEVSIWYGEPEVGKSNILLDAGLHVASNEEYCRRRVQQGAVLYVAPERGGLIKRRAIAWKHHHNAHNVPFAIIDDAVDLRTSMEDAERIITASRDLSGQTDPVIWIIIDTLNRALAGGEENSTKDMGALMMAVDQIHRATGAHVSLIHHPPKHDPKRLRGHSSVPAGADMTLCITKEGNVATVEIDKANDLPFDERSALSFTFRSVELRRDPDTGIVTTAPVVIPVQSTVAKPAKARKGPKSKAAKTALSALKEAVDQVGAVPPASNHIPSNTRVVTFAQWRDYCYRKGISTSDEPRALRAAFQRATENLIGDGFVAAWNEQAWVA
jgi:hypothetical protein